MRLQRRVVQPGDKQNLPKAGDTVTIQYAGWVHDGRNGNNDFKGRQFDARTVECKLGIGAVIRGLDTILPQMSLGERTVWIISADLGYGKSGLPQVVPPDTDLVLEIELIAINGKKA